MRKLGHLFRKAHKVKHESREKLCNWWMFASTYDSYMYRKGNTYANCKTRYMYVLAFDSTIFWHIFPNLFTWIVFFFCPVLIYYYCSCTTSASLSIYTLHSLKRTISIYQYFSETLSTFLFRIVSMVTGDYWCRSMFLQTCWMQLLQTALSYRCHNTLISTLCNVLRGDLGIGIRTILLHC